MPASWREDIQKVLPKGRFEDLLFLTNDNPYKSKVTDQPCPPTEDDIKADEDALTKLLAGWPVEDRSWPEARAPHIAEELYGYMDRVAQRMVETLLEDGRLKAGFYRTVENVDYTDRVQQRLDARARALAGRGQDLAQLTADGVPDTSAPMVALMLGASKGQGASLEPVEAGLYPAHVTSGRPRRRCGRRRRPSGGGPLRRRSSPTSRPRAPRGSPSWPIFPPSTAT